GLGRDLGWGAAFWAAGGALPDIATDIGGTAAGFANLLAAADDAHTAAGLGEIGGGGQVEVAAHARAEVCGGWVRRGLGAAAPELLGRGCDRGLGAERSAGDRRGSEGTAARGLGAKRAGEHRERATRRAWEAGAEGVGQAFLAGGAEAILGRVEDALQ